MRRGIGERRPTRCVRAPPVRDNDWGQGLYIPTRGAALEAERQAMQSRAREAADDAHQYNWDRLRVVASLDIVGSHLAGEHLFWGVGTPLFLMLAIAFGVQRSQPVATRDFVAKRARRVLLPWLAWSVVIHPSTAARLMF